MFNNDIFADAALHWDLERLYQALAVAKQQISPRSRKGLTEREKLFLRGLLCGYSPAEIARKLFQSPKGVEVYVCKTLYQYLKKMIDAPGETTIGNWRNLNSLLEEAGYKTQFSPHSRFKNFSTMEPLVNITNIGVIQNSQDSVTFDINIRVVISSPCESEEEKLNLEENTQENES